MSHNQLASGYPLICATSWPPLSRPRPATIENIPASLREGRSPAPWRRQWTIPPRPRRPSRRRWQAGRNEHNNAGAQLHLGIWRGELRRSSRGGPRAPSSESLAGALRPGRPCVRGGGRMEPASAHLESRASASEGAWAHLCASSQPASPARVDGWGKSWRGSSAAAAPSLGRRPGAAVRSSHRPAAAAPFI